MKYILKIVKWIAVAIILFQIVHTLLYPFRGQSDFTTTTLYYALALFIPLVLLYFKKIKWSSPLLLMLSLIISLYSAEVILRYLIKYPITYSEREKGIYKTLYDSPYNRFSFMDKLHDSTLSKRLHLLPPNAIRDYKTPEFDYTKERTNRYGLRGKVPSKSKKVIITLGDSFTESVGSPGDSTYPQLLQAYMAKSNQSIEILNGGVSGSDPFFEFQLLKTLSDTFNLEAAIFMINSTDNNDVMVRGGAERFLPNGDLQYRKASWWEPIYAISFVFRLFIHNVGGYSYTLMTQKQEEQETLKAANDIAHYFDAVILPWAASKNIKVYVVLQPFLAEVANPTLSYNENHQQLSALPTNYFNLADSLRTIKSINNYYWPRDGHFNSKGYTCTARFIYNTFFSVDTNKLRQPLSTHLQ